MKLLALTDHVLIKRIEEENETKSGIILTVDKTEKPEKGEVVSIPEDGTYFSGTTKVTMDIKVGDIVYFTKYAPDEIQLPDETYLVIKYTSILAKMGG